MGIFKANDIRGLYPGDWDKNTAYRIGTCLPDIIPGKNIVIGRDGRESSNEILKYLIKGLIERGVTVTDIGRVDTPAVYFSIGNYDFDGDGDRTIFIDERGKWISPDLIIALLGLYYFKHFPEKRGDADGVLYDARSTNSISDYITTLGGKLPGHYYYRDFFNLDNGWIPFLQVLAILSLERKAFSDLIAEINKYNFSGEINFHVPDGEILINKLKKKYYSGKQTFLDGLRVDFDDWWFLVRMANTEPVLRLVVEGRDEYILEQRVSELKKLIYQSGGSDYIS